MADDERTDGVVDETEDLFRFDEFIAAKQEGGEEIDLEELLEALGELPDDAPPGGGGSDAAEGTGDPAGEPPAPQRGRAPAPGRAAAAAAPGAPALAEEPSGEPAAPRAGVPWLVVGAAVLLNAAVLGYALWSGRAVKEYVAELGAQVVETAERMQTENEERALAIESLAAPVAVLDPLSYQAFERVEEELGQGDYRGARRRLYSLLAIADRLEEDVRAEVEPRASFLLADALRLEAEARLEAADPGRAPAEVGP